MINPIRDFLQRYYDFQRPLLLGYSGGPDSKALLHALLGVPLHVAHVDHGWRKESREEAAILQKEVEGLGLPFHLHVLKGVPAREEICREHRLQFFKEVKEKVGAEALLLGHHRGDLAETVLKRVLEGAHLIHLYGMKEVSVWEGMQIWRPLLSVSKEEIYAFLREKNLTWFEDMTNQQNTYLRGRMRGEILPFLRKSFGKEIEENLCQLSHRSQELAAYWKSREICKGPWGKYIDLNLLHSVEVRNELIRFLGYTPPRGELEQLVEWVLNGERNKKVGEIFVDQGLAFIFSQPEPLEVVVREGVQQVGNWRVMVEKSSAPLSTCDWKKVFMGKGEVVVPKGEYRLGIPKPGVLYGKTALRKWWSGWGVPAILRYTLPILYKEDLVYREFLTGKIKNNESLSIENYSIRFEYIV